ncbi:hypothetical protein Rhopal_007207-T1 [Rhodotorula paludigena]|uniref:Fcf2 pre-rRNA processing C-terminal domain-containing protein n=1 Tax=Rhodotorula paludigena TaxID=86838 RepID=A0AAV5H062_9BASI|nr:hypothetical protein Rhopal_007207-T1 [Rhodotorula paludigena]
MPLTRAAVARLASSQASASEHDHGHESISSTLRSPSPEPSIASIAVDPATPALPALARDSHSSHSSSSSSDSDSDSDPDSDTSDADSDATAVSHSHLGALLAKAKEAARARADDAANKAKGGAGGAQGDTLADNDEVVLFGDELDDEDEAESSDDEGQGAAILPASLSRPLALSHPTLSSARPSSSSSSASFPPRPTAGGISLSQDLGAGLADSGATRVGAAVDVKGKGKAREDAGGKGDKWGQAPLPQLSKKQIRAKQPHTAGAAWFDLPAQKMTPELKRELDALRLSQALDPKRFMRGGAKKDKVGEFFQVGHVISPSTRATTLSSAARVAKRSFVDDLVADEEAKAYAKRKTREITAKGMSGRKRQRRGGKGAYAMGEGRGK